MSHSERVTGPHAFYLQLEETGLAMHAGGLGIFDAEPLTRSDGLLEIEKIEAVIEWALGHVPHARQRLRQVPFEQQPVWVDDNRFNLHYHVRHTRLPRPGSERQLKRLVGRLMSERLDRKKPLWEAWVIEGVEQRRIALMVKVHPSVLEGAQLQELFAKLADLPEAGALGVPAWRARRAPAPAQLMADSAVHWAKGAQEALERTRDAMGEPITTLRSVARTTAAMRSVVSESLRGLRQPTPLNPSQIGVHRRVDVLHASLTRVKQVAEALGCGVPDVALALLGGALGHFLRARGEKLEGSEIHVLSSLPGEAPDGRTATLRLPLWVDDREPVRRVLDTTAAHSRALASQQLAAFEVLEQVEAWTPTLVQRAISQAGGRRGTAHLVVQFMEGPERPFQILGARAHSLTTFVPLFIDQALSVAITSSGDQLSFGLNSDWDLFQDLHGLVLALEAELEALCAATAQMSGTTLATGGRRSA